MRIAEAYVEIRVDRKQAESEAKSAAQSAHNAIKDVFKGALVIKGIQESIGAASDLQQSIGATSAVFGTATKAVDDFSKTSASSFGISERAARELTSQLGALLQGFGFTASEAASTSVEITKLGADLSAAFGGKPEEAVQALGSALRGEFDPLERYGVSLNAARIAAKAVELGLASSTTTVDANAKATAALALIQESSAGVAGQFGREIDTAAGQQAVAAAKAEEAAASFGDVLLPVYTKVVEVVGTLAGAFGDLPGPVQTALVGLAGMAAFSGPLGSVKDVVVDLAGALVKVSGSATAAYGALGAVGGVLALAGGLYLAYNQDKQRAKAITDDFVSALQAEAQGQKDATRALIARQIVDSKYLPLSEKLGLSIGDVASVITGKSVPAYDKARAGIDAILDSTAGYNVKNYELQEQYGITADEAANFRAEIDRLSTGYGAAVVETAKLDEANRALGVGTDEAASATTDLEAATADLVPTVDEAADASKKLADRQQDATKRAEEHRQALEDLYDTLLGQIDAEYAYEKASADQGDAVRELDGVLADKEATLLDVRDAIFGAKDASIEMAKAFVDSKGASLDSKAGVDLMIQSLYEQATALGPDSPLRQELLDYIAELQKIPSQIDTSIRLSVTGQTVNINPSRAGDVIGIRSLPSVAVASAAGRYVPGRSNLLSTFGEQGPEAILPLDKPGRLEQLLGDPRIGEPVAAAMGGTTTTKSSPIVLNNYRRDLTVHDVAQLVTIARLSQ